MLDGQVTRVRRSRGDESRSGRIPPQRRTRPARAATNQVHRPAAGRRHGRPELILDIERVLDVSARQTLRAKFRFAPEVPLIVCVEFVIEDGPRVLWRIGRGLLQQRRYSVSGLGDVRLWPSHAEDRATQRKHRPPAPARPTRPRAGSALSGRHRAVKGRRRRQGCEKSLPTVPDDTSIRSAQVSKSSATAARRQPHRGIADCTDPIRQPAQPPSGERSKSRRRHLAATRPGDTEAQAYSQVNAPFRAASVAPAGVRERAAAHRRSPPPRRTASRSSSPNGPARCPPGCGR